jgi:hypothetical protein
VVRSYTDNLDRTITDNGTGLMWEKLTDDGTIHDKDNTYKCTQAFQKVADLNTENFAVHNDWRLPNINELQTLADYGTFNPAVSAAFNGGDSFTQSSVYWSSTTNNAGNTSFAWVVGFNEGRVGTGNEENFNCVCAVRGGS